MDFASRLKELRKEKAITQDKLAEEFGVTKGTVSVWERGIRKPEFGTIEKLADYFHVGFAYLMGQSCNKHDGVPADESAAKWSGEDDMEDFLRASELYWQLSPHSRQIVRGCITAAYRADQLAGILEKNRFEVKVNMVQDDAESGQY